MTYPIFKKGQPGAKRSADGRYDSPMGQEIKALPREGDDPTGYVIEEDLSHAINVSLLLGMPLLLTGEPGTGKTELGRAIAHELGLEEPLVFETKSTSQAKDLFYTFDVLGRFGAKDVAGASTDPLDYISYQALGRAILDAFDAGVVKDLLPPAASGYTHAASPRRSVVIIDEIDKAPRDFPNDLLNEIERMAFRVPELRNKATPGMEKRAEGVPAHLRPIVIITSNSEKGLPDPFLRRCVYYDIAFPDETALRRIVLSRVGETRASSALVNDAFEIFRAFREESGRHGLQDKPSTAELLNWLQTLSAMGFSDDQTLKRPDAAQKIRQSLVALVKDPEDRPRAATFVNEWCGAAPGER